MDVVGEGEGGMNGKSSINVYTLPCVKHMAGKKLPYNTRSPGRCSVMTERSGERGGEGGSRGR